MKVKSIIYMVLALSLCCGCSDWLTVDSKTILSEEDIAKYPELVKGAKPHVPAPRPDCHFDPGGRDCRRG